MILVKFACKLCGADVDGFHEEPEEPEGAEEPTGQTFICPACHSPNLLPADLITHLRYDAFHRQVLKAFGIDEGELA